MTARKVQLVLQGGGARLFALIAALEVIDKAREDGSIEITRIAGTSAGAIAGGLYAAGVRPAEMKAAFAHLDLSRILRRPASAWAQKCFALGLFWKLYKGEPIASDLPLKETLEQLLRGADLANMQLRQVETPLLILAADASEHQAIVYDSNGNGRDKTLISCLLDSSALPFFFRAARRDAQTLILDGGLVENLPAERLTNSEDGPILALSFQEEPGSTPRNALQLMMSLINTGIGASVRKAKGLGNIFLVELNTAQVGTFDFEKAQEILRGERPAPYDNARYKTRHALDELLTSTGRLISNTRWDGIDPTTSAQILEVYKQQHEARPFKQYLRRFTIVAHSLLTVGEEDFGSRDVVSQYMEFSPSHDPIDCLMARIHVTPGQKPSNVYVQVSDDQGREVPVIPIPIAAISEAGEEIYALQLSFTPPLQPSSSGNPRPRYSMRTEFRIASAFSELPEKHRDSMGTGVTRAEGGVDLLELELHVPKSCSRLQFGSLEGEGHFACKPAQGNLFERQRKGHFKPILWRACGVPNDHYVCLELQLPPDAT